MPSTSVPLLAVAGLSAVVLLLLRIRRLLLPRPIPGIPYRKSSANLVLGDAPDMLQWKNTTGEMWRWVCNTAEQLDSPIVQVFMRPFGRPWVVITDFREAQDIQVNRQHEFDRSKILEEVFRPVLPGNHSWMPTADKFRAHRWLIRDTMSPTFLREIVAPSIHETTRELLLLWQEKARLADGRPFECTEDLIKLMVDIIHRTTFGISSRAVHTQVTMASGVPEIDVPASVDDAATLPQAPDPQEYTLVRKIVNSLDIAFKSPFPKLALHFALNCFPSLVVAFRWKDHMMARRINDARKKFGHGMNSQEKPSVKSAIDSVVQREAQAAAEDDKRLMAYDVHAVRDEIFGFFAAGHETSSTTLGWAMKHLSLHQDVQQKLRLAIRNAYPQASALPSANEIMNTNVPYLDAFIQENHRLCTTIPAIVRMTTCDVVVLGHRIPKGTDVFMMSNGPSFQSPAYEIDERLRSPSSREIAHPTGAWKDEDISEFKPERWLVRRDERQDVFEIRSGPSLPYGFGTRSCFGVKLATLELRMVLTMLVWTYHLRPLPVKLSDFKSADVNTHRPQHVHIRLQKV